MGCGCERGLEGGVRRGAVWMWLWVGVEGGVFEGGEIEGGCVDVCVGGCGGRRRCIDVGVGVKG